jgi:hypothetical protein
MGILDEKLYNMNHVFFCFVKLDGNIGWKVVQHFMRSYFKYLEITSNKFTIFKWFQRTTLHLYLSLIPKGNAITFMYIYSFSICYMVELCMYIWHMDHCLLEVALSFLKKQSPCLVTIAQHINMTSMTFNHLCHLSVRANLYK